MRILVVSARFSAQAGRPAATCQWHAAGSWHDATVPGDIRLCRPRRARGLLGRCTRLRVQPPPEGFDSWPAALAAFGVPESEWNSRSAILPGDGDGPRVFFQRVPEGKSVKNRVHLDVRVATELRGDERMAALETEADRLEALGATRAYRVEPAPPMESASSPCATPRATSSASTDARPWPASAYRLPTEVTFGPRVLPYVAILLGLPVATGSRGTSALETGQQW